MRLRRRRFLELTGLSGTTFLAGCAGDEDSSTAVTATESRETTPSQIATSPPKRSTLTSERTQGATPTETRTSAPTETKGPTPTETGKSTPTRTTTPESTPVIRDPLSIRQGELDVQQIVPQSPEGETYGFRDDDESKEFNSLVSENRDYTSLFVELEGTSYGTGQMAANGGGFYQTAWKAPETGTYRVTANYWGFGGYSYAPQDNENRDVSITFESNLGILNPSATRVLTQRTQPDLRERNAKMATEVAEQLLEFLAGRLISVYLGVIGGFIARQVISWAIELTPRQKRSGSFSIDRYDTRQISVNLEAQKGETYLIQFTPSVGWSAHSRVDDILNVNGDAKYYLENFSLKRTD